MDFLLQTLLSFFSPPKLICERKVWERGVLELRRRTGGKKESGAFLLGKKTAGIRKIEQFLFYDDVDPHCFDRGIVEFDGGKFGKVWEICRSLKMSVVADVHVHPGHFAQSVSDQDNPMIPEKGHLALILPYFAARECLPGKMGIYEYLGMRKWRDHSLKGNKIFNVKGIK